MPLPNDARVLKLAEDLLAQLESMFGEHPGMRPAHSRGVMAKGVFVPTAEAQDISKAPHFEMESTPVSVRFSASSGFPTILDTDPKANPRGMAIRFHLAERVHTDIVSHSANGFPVRTGEEFLEFLKAAAGAPGEIEAFLGANPAALRYVQMPKPFPASYATEAFFGVSAVEFENAQGVKRFGRYRIVPEVGVRHLDEEAVSKMSDTYLMDELRGRLLAVPVAFQLLVQLADAGDVADDSTVHWPETRQVVELGRLELNGVVDDNLAEQKHTIFDPIARVVGIEPSEDPLFELRAAIYLISGRKRREA